MLLPVHDVVELLFAAITALEYLDTKTAEQKVKRALEMLGSHEQGMPITVQYASKV